MNSDDSKEDDNQEIRNLFKKALLLIPDAVRIACHKRKYKANKLEIDGLRQQISVKLFKNNYAALRSLENHESLKPWLQKIADNLVANYAHRQRRNLSLEGFRPDAFPVKATQEEMVIAKEQRQLRKKKINAALSKLTPRQRKLYELSCQDDLDDARIAELMGIAVKSVRELRHRMKERLKVLVKEGDTDSPGRKK
jgi:RNA polymerase sigma factor (sigma-70 family)